MKTAVWCVAVALGFVAICCSLGAFWALIYSIHSSEEEEAQDPRGR